MEAAAEDVCRTPQRYKIPAAAVCPAAPKKKAAVFLKQQIAPRDGYFQPPDLELFFAVAFRREV
ncbi:hypothetical protein CDL12_26156 [Handroanthus impetiginosus]|uniref:Uncharacterized protein n=1 Tax=Handroanthus impetiginosus TaxID=429701 RepID=A0A2G9G7Q2_9LAMI|nr:hypothetical protein CDL12_26778 [Handroanthus impetiginosus]PIN01333.1 hypothetical protein CDL12_26156 [Handroanthus impetiginosus]